MHGIWLASYVVAWLLVTALIIVAISLVWALGKVHLKDAPESSVLITDEGPHLHGKMQQFEVLDHTGNPIRTEDYKGCQWILLMLSPECEPCDKLLQQVMAVKRRVATDTKIIIVLEAASDVVTEAVRRYQLTTPIVADREARLRTHLGVERTPYGLAINESGFVQMKGVVNTGLQLEGLMLYRGRSMSNVSWQTEPEDSLASPV